MNFISLDFEKASSEKTSICAVGISEVQENTIVSTVGYKVRPVPFKVDPRMQAIHGLNLDDLVQAPSFDFIWPELVNKIEGNLIIAHNVGMDISLLGSVLKYYQISFPRFRTLCTWQLAPLIWPKRESYSLEALASFLDLKGNAHQADDDSRMCAELAIKIFQESGIKQENQLKSVLKYLPGRFSPGFYKRPKLIRTR